MANHDYYMAMEAQFPDVPVRVCRIFFDDQGRRCTRFVAICDFCGEDNFHNAELIAEIFNQQGNKVQPQVRSRKVKGKGR